MKLVKHVTLMRLGDINYNFSQCAHDLNREPLLNTSVFLAPQLQHFQIELIHHITRLSRDCQNPHDNANQEVTQEALI